MRFRLVFTFSVMMASLWALPACGGGAGREPAVAVPTPLATLPAPAAMEPVPTATLLAAATVPTAAPTASPTRPADGNPAAWAQRPPGLVFRTLEALWMIDGSEQAVSIGASQDVLSPDGSQLLSYDFASGELWLNELATGERQQLAVLPDSEACCFQWWPAKPGMVVFGSLPPGRERGPGIMGYLGIIDLAAGTVTLVDTEHDSGPTAFALSPDGTSIAYGGGDGGWLYSLEGGIQPFSPASYGLSGSKGVQIGSPAWSPDGRQLAWIVSGGLGPNGEFRTAVAIFDLAAGSHHLLHPYEPEGRGGWPFAPVWSPDGEWLAFTVGATNMAESGVWAARADGSGGEHRFGWGGTPVWSPDGRWLALSLISEQGVPATMIAERGSWSLHNINLPMDTFLVDWLPHLP